MKTASTPVFFYGTLLDTDIRARVLGHPVAPARLRPATLKGHRAVYMRGRRYPMLEAALGQDVQGEVLLDCSGPEWTALCRYEGPEYEAVKMEVWCESAPITARVFQARPPFSSSGTVWSLSEWRMRHKRLYLRRQLI